MANTIFLQFLCEAAFWAAARAQFGFSEVGGRGFGSVSDGRWQRGIATGFGWLYQGPLTH